jgi:hypothetical protein
MNKNQDVDKNDMMPLQDEPPSPKTLEQAQKDAAEEREKEGGYQ